MLEVFGMHGRAGLKPAIPRQKYASLKAFLFKRFNYLEINAFPLPPPVPSSRRDVSDAIPWLDVAIFNERSRIFRSETGGYWR